MSAQWLHPACESHKVKHFDGFLELTRFVVQAPRAWPVSLAAFKKRAISQTGQSKVSAFLQADSSRTSRRPPFRTFTPGLRFPMADYIFFVIVHDVVSDIIGTFFRG